MTGAPWQGRKPGGFSESGPGDVSPETRFWAASRGGWDPTAHPGFSLPAGDPGLLIGVTPGL